MIWHNRVQFIQARYTGVCDKNTPPEKKALAEISFENTNSGAGEEFLLKDCRGDARLKGMFFSQTLVSALRASARVSQGGGGRSP